LGRAFPRAKVNNRFHVKLRQYPLLDLWKLLHRVPGRTSVRWIKFFKKLQGWQACCRARSYFSAPKVIFEIINVRI
jgi:hypothetical protein